MVYNNIGTKATTKVRSYVQVSLGGSDGCVYNGEKASLYPAPLPSLLHASSDDVHETELRLELGSLLD